MYATRLATIALVVCACSLLAEESPSPPVPLAQTVFVPPLKGPRYLAFINDLHLGLGREPGGAWNPKEDFRWDKALEGFLNEISRIGNDQVDLVIVGDFLELWQPPVGVNCKGLNADLGCTVAEMQGIVKAVIQAHPEALASLRRFSQRGENRLHIIPGNHDSTLLLAPVWELLGVALEAKKGRINLVTSGVWVSPDGRIVAEHGHQIGSDVNRYDTWPDVVRHVNATSYVVRPWGERFVQKLFNTEEEQYPLIDNLSPETAGARYRMADRGLWKSISDVARFLAFNLFETSLNQKAYFLGPDPNKAERPSWDVAVGRGFGYRLFADALDENDPFRKLLLEDAEESRALRKELDSLAKNKKALPDEEVRLLCDQIAIRVGANGKKCEPAQLGHLFESNVVPREWVLREHLLARRAQFKGMRVFIYGHTHQLEEEWILEVPGTVNVKVSVLNTGAFQRVVDEKGYLKRVRNKGVSPGEGLRRLGLEDLPPCYTVVLVPYDGSVPKPVTKRWHMEEDGTGTLVNPGDPRCN
jgi:UDP-2,3-diacylglucosamine pyrophosphatase LpxH